MKIWLRVLTLLIPVMVVHQAHAVDPSSPYGINTHVPSAADLDQVAAAGIGWVRVDFNWNQLEPARDQYNWALADSVVNSAVARGLNVFVTLAYTPDWANGGQGIAIPPTDPNDWYDFVFDMVSRYKTKVKYWGMWNEPNLEQFFKGGAKVYVEDILVRGAEAARTADPGALILGPELAHLSSGHWAAWLYYVLTEAPESIDIITQHVYSGSGYDVIRDLDGWIPVWDKPTVMGVIEAAGASDKPLWLTETGWHTDEVTEEEQATYYTQLLDGVLEEEWLDKVFFYELKDDPNIPEKWGILRADNSRKPSWTAYRDYIGSHGRVK